MTFLVLFLFGSLIVVFARLFGLSISGKELIVAIGSMAIIAGAFSWIVYHENILDHEIWNGKIVKKEQESVSCSHSYDCHCHQSCSGSGKDRTCREVCDTCHEHSRDYDWIIRTSNDEKIEIPRIDRQGTSEPPRYSSALIGEPTAQEHRYKNYLLGAPESILQTQISDDLKNKYQQFVPKHPEIFDYYRANQVLPVQVSITNLSEWNKKLSEINASLGAKKQVNIILVLTTLPSEFYSVLRAEWKGGKKNDVIVVVGVNQDLTPQWVETMAWAVDGGLGTYLRYDILNTLSDKQVNSDELISIIAKNISQHYVRKPMKNFEYLAASIRPSTGQWVLCLFCMAAISSLLVFVCHKYDFFGDEVPQFFSRKRILK